jgi:glyoxylase-like metal-dependent hydrolase (beta-lactamase superfamily II)
LIEVAAGICLIDCLFADLPEQCGVFLLRGGMNALIDSGPSGGVEQVIEGLKALGIGEDDLHYILLTHTHLDHAGGASSLLERFPRARILVDEGTARYLVDPARLLKSAIRALGDIASYYGTMRPVPAERIISLRDGHRLDLGEGRSLRAVHTPGHSAGHFAFLEEGSGALLCGDCLGHLIADHGYVFPATPAPEFDAELSAASARKLAGLEPALLCFPHFGVTDRAKETFDLFLTQLERSLAMAEEARGLGGDPAFLAAYLLREMPPMKEGEKRLLTGIQEVNAAGMLHYLQSKEAG